jgi:F-type H+-transporting ATPase subunit delta
MGILASHVPSVEELKPGLLEVVEGSGTKKWFGGYRLVDNDAGEQVGQLADLE